MRILLLIVVCSLLGVVLGGFSSWKEFDGVKERFDPHNGDNVQEAQIADVAQKEGKALGATSGSRVKVDGELHDFGEISRGSKGAHQFVFTNTGTAPLQIRAGGTSCPACTVSDVPKSELAPGESMPITVTWNAISPDPEFRKEAYIQTSDPERPLVILVIKGKVQEAVRLHPSELTLSSVTSTSAMVAEARILLNVPGQMNIVSHHFSNEDLASFFEVEFQPLTESEAARLQAKAGYTAKITIKKGLPLGSLNQVLHITTDFPGAERLDLPIQGAVVSEVSILSARNFDSKKNILTLGLVKRDKGAKVTLPVLIKGQHRDNVELSVGSIRPESAFKVTLGEPKSINEGAVRMVPLQIEVPIDSPPVSLMGGTEASDYGQIILHTTHPEAKEIKIWVRFAVE
ncbi:MAG: DUF1573 domain-containing protein [Pirellulales bacterium]